MRRTIAIHALVSAFFFFAAAPALAGGFEYADHSTKAMSRGGSAVAETEGASAVYYNPAGLAGLKGLQFELDGELAILKTKFQRTAPDTNGDLQNTGDAVSNARNPWTAPFLAISYQLIPKLTVALAGFGPSAFALRGYPDPRTLQPTAWDGDLSNNPSDYSATSTGAPQRYNLIDSTIIVFYPSLAVGYEPLPWLSIGLTGQVVVANTAFSQAIYAGFGPGEDPANDAIANLDVFSKPAFTGIVGLQLRPIEGLSIGASYRPGVSVTSKGSLDISFADAVLQTGEAAGGLEQTANDAVFYNDFPSLLRAGVAYQGKGWLAEVGGTWEGWSRVKEFRVDTSGVKVFLGDNEIPVPELVIPKNWKDSFSLRVGGRFDVGTLLGKSLPLQLRAGYVYETSAIPSDTLALDFITGSRNQVTLGASYDLGAFSISLAGSRLFQAARTVTTSKVTQTTSTPPFGLPPFDGAVVGTGTYEASTTLIYLGIEGHFLGQ